MKFYIVALLTLFAACALSATTKAAQKAVIVSYPDDTPDFIVSQAMDVIRAAV